MSAGAIVSGIPSRAFTWVADLDGASPITIKAPATGKRVVVGFIAWTVDAAATVDMYWTSNIAANRLTHLARAAGEGFAPTLPAFFVGAVDAVLYINASAGNLKGTIAGWEI